MFRDKQNYRAVAFRSPHLSTPADLLQLFPPTLVERVDVQAAPEEHFEAVHCYYYSPQVFTRTEFLPECQKLIDGVEHYRYNMYLIGVCPEKTRFHLVAVPFLEMALNVYPLIIAKSRGRSFHYQRIDLQRLTEVLSAPHGKRARPPMTRVMYRADGDDFVDSIAFQGADIPQSGGMRAILSTLKAMGISLSPEAVCMSFGTGADRLLVDLDKAGHFKFRVSRGAVNLRGIASVLGFFQRNKLLKESLSFPYMRRLKEERLEAGENG